METLSKRTRDQIIEDWYLFGKRESESYECFFSSVLGAIQSLRSDGMKRVCSISRANNYCPEIVYSFPERGGFLLGIPEIMTWNKFEGYEGEMFEGRTIFVGLSKELEKKVIEAIRNRD